MTTTATTHRPACRACGTWVCDDCGAKRHYASRFSRSAQLCPQCGSINGRMEAVRHRDGRADSHDESFEEALAEGHTVRYPLASTMAT
jgi:hypothetical protein